MVLFVWSRRETLLDPEDGQAGEIPATFSGYCLSLL
jgi:hypothetical protein